MTDQHSITHERLMAAFADLSRMLDVQQQDTQNTTEKPVAR